MIWQHNAYGKSQKDMISINKFRISAFSKGVIILTLEFMIHT